MKINNILLDVTKQNIFKFINPIDVFTYYLDKPVFDKAFSSPFRKDNNPSFIVKASKGYWKDYATGEYGDCFAFVKNLYKVDFNSALLQVINDLGLKQHFNTPSGDFKFQNKVAKVKNAITGKTYTGNFKLKIKKRKWTVADIQYWESYGISKKAAIWANIVPISHYFVNGIPHMADIYAYAYIENKDNIISYKIYQPFSKFKKWINSNDFSVWELWKGTRFNAVYSKKLVITSSRKDAICVINNVHWPSTAFQAENIHPKRKVMLKLFETYPKVHLLFDNDFTKTSNWGQIAARRLLLEYPDNLINVVIPDKYNAKDPSDLMFYHGKEKGTKILNNLLNDNSW